MRTSPIVKMNTEKRPVICTALYRKPMQPSIFEGILYQLESPLNFFTRFSQEDPFLKELQEETKK